MYDLFRSIWDYVISLFPEHDAPETEKDGVSAEEAEERVNYYGGEYE